jgi:hypothetical protein
MKVTHGLQDAGAETPTNPAEAGVLLHVVAGDPRTQQDAIAEAVHTVREAIPAEHPHGILLTRHSESLFTVTHSPAVPHGTTMEQDRWHRH